jgi:hypothetical protein
MPRDVTGARCAAYTRNHHGSFRGQEFGSAVSNSGNADAGRLNVTGADNGSLSGTFRSGILGAG